MRRTFLTKLPAATALVIQLLSFLLVAVLFLFLPIRGEPEVALFLAAVIQGLIAAAMTWLCRLPPWWLVIQFLFPVGLICALGLQLPPVIFLAGFLVLMGLYWAVAVTRVPLYLSGPAVWRSVAELLPQGRRITFIDIGSGLGGVVLFLSRLRPESAFVGIELAPLPWLVSRIRGCVTKSTCRFMRGNYNRLDFSDYDVVFAYLSPWVMDGVWQKANAEMRPGSLLLSCEFPVSGVKPDMAIRSVAGGPVLYGWRM